MIMSFVSSRVLEKISTMSLTLLTFEPKIPKSAFKGQRFKYDLRSFLILSYSKSNYVGFTICFVFITQNLSSLFPFFSQKETENHPRESSPFLGRSLNFCWCNLMYLGWFNNIHLYLL